MRSSILGLQVRWVGGLVIDDGKLVTLIDTPEGVVGELSEGELSRLRTILITSSRMYSVGGFLALAAALPADRALPLTVVFASHDLKVGSVVDSWLQNWATPEVEVDGITPGIQVELPGFVVNTLSVSAVERSAPFDAVISFAVSLRHTEGGKIIYFPPSRPSSSWTRAVSGADLAVVQHDGRSSMSEVVNKVKAAKEVWIVDQQGFVGAEC